MKHLDRQAGAAKNIPGAKPKERMPVGPVERDPAGADLLPL